MKNLAMKAGMPTFLSLLVLALAAGPAASQEPKAYLLMCKPGNNLLNVEHLVGRNGLYVNITMTFSRSGKAASAGLGPGQCAWSDRGVSSREPAVLSMKFEQSRLSVRIEQRSGGADVGYVPLRASARSSNSDEPQLRRLVRALQSKQDFQVYAYTKGSSLVVTRFGP